MGSLSKPGSSRPTRRRHPPRFASDRPVQANFHRSTARDGGCYLRNSPHSQGMDSDSIEALITTTSIGSDRPGHPVSQRLHNVQSKRVRKSRIRKRSQLDAIRTCRRAALSAGLLAGQILHDNEPIFAFSELIPRALDWLSCSVVIVDEKVRPIFADKAALALIDRGRFRSRANQPCTGPIRLKESLRRSQPFTVRIPRYRAG